MTWQLYNHLFDVVRGLKITRWWGLGCFNNRIYTIEVLNVHYLCRDLDMDMYKWYIHTNIYLCIGVDIYKCLYIYVQYKPSFKVTSNQSPSTPTWLAIKMVGASFVQSYFIYIYIYRYTYICHSLSWVVIIWHHCPSGNWKGQ